MMRYPYRVTQLQSHSARIEKDGSMLRKFYTIEGTERMPVQFITEALHFFSPRRLTLKKSTKEHLRKAYSRLQEANKRGKEMVRRVKKQFAHQVNYGKLSRDGGNMVITFGVLLSVIRVALHLTGDQIQLSDIMRYVGLGALKSARIRL